MRTIRALLGVAALSLSGSVIADTILYTVDDLGGGRWQYNYTLENTGATSIDGFTVFFDLGVYANLGLTADVADWDTLLFDPDPSLGDDGILDSLALVAAVAPGAIVSGWSVAFDLLIGNAPGDQSFEVYAYDLSTDDVTIINDGRTTRVVSDVPEPATLGMLASALLLLLMMRRRQLAYPARRN